MSVPKTLTIDAEYWDDNPMFLRQAVAEFEHEGEVGQVTLNLGGGAFLMTWNNHAFAITPHAFVEACMKVIEDG